MKLVMGYELPLVLALIVVVIKTGGQLSLAAIAGQTPALSISGMLAFLVALLCIQAKLGFVPFDIAEAETEVASGVLIEYSGALLAVWKLMQAMMLVALPLFLVVVFLGGFGTSGWPLVWGIGKYVLILVLLILIKNTNPRMRIDQAMKFFWVYCGLALVTAIALAIIGNSCGISWL
jgi:NADH-quinone oxidoreductase subunit H